MMIRDNFAEPSVYDLAPISLMLTDLIEGEAQRFRSLGQWTDRSSFAAGEISQQSFLAALAAGLQVPGEHGDVIFRQQRIGHVEFDLRAAIGISTVEIVRLLVPNESYRLLTARAVAGDYQPWSVVSQVEFDGHGHGFPLWVRRDVAGEDSSTATPPSSGKADDFAGDFAGRVAA